jgi:hypothetical protein
VLLGQDVAEIRQLNGQPGAVGAEGGDLLVQVKLEQRAGTVKVALLE